MVWVPVDGCAADGPSSFTGLRLGRRRARTGQLRRVQGLRKAHRRPFAFAPSGRGWLEGLFLPRFNPEFHFWPGISTAMGMMRHMLRWDKPDPRTAALEWPLLNGCAGVAALDPVLSGLGLPAVSVGSLRGGVVRTGAPIEAENGGVGRDGFAGG